ncbi:MAG: amidohydrolase family protein [Xanthomonadales bacterium]|jgi:predicted TIM-barrel fold metal-dependent hydrolase|nr:amidohydrolase family protein [Xanthomonadales bacterium]MDH3940509.1 amidohydrolase family protein [Xanthomonadales bacterium]MDH4001846.1 amidohydrolase family protein [Xanthomonadales bacterium]
MRFRNQQIFDAHFHIIDPRFSLVPNRGYLPDRYTINDYRERTKEYDIRGGAIVSGSFQAFDQDYLVDALSRLGPGFVGVTQLPATVSDADILELDKTGVRAIRFNLKRGGSEQVTYLDSMARRVHELAGWHTELYADAQELEDLVTVLIALPAVSIDHLGLSAAGFKILLKLAEHGIRVKATGFGRVDFSVGDALKALYAANPDSLMFGTDLPSTRANRPFSDRDYQLVGEALGGQAAERVFWSNAARFYRVAA